MAFGGVRELSALDFDFPDDSELSLAGPICQVNQRFFHQKFEVDLVPYRDRIDVAYAYLGSSVDTSKVTADFISIVPHDSDRFFLFVGDHVGHDLNAAESSLRVQKMLSLEHVQERLRFSENAYQALCDLQRVIATEFKPGENGDRAAHQVPEFALTLMHICLLRKEVTVATSNAIEPLCENSDGSFEYLSRSHSPVFSGVFHDDPENFPAIQDMAVHSLVNRKVHVVTDGVYDSFGSSGAKDALLERYRKLLGQSPEDTVQAILRQATDSSDDRMVACLQLK